MRIKAWWEAYTPSSNRCSSGQVFSDGGGRQGAGVLPCLAGNQYGELSGSWRQTQTGLKPRSLCVILAIFSPPFSGPWFFIHKTNLKDHFLRPFQLTLRFWLFPRTWFSFAFLFLWRWDEEKGPVLIHSPSLILGISEERLGFFHLSMKNVSNFKEIGMHSIHALFVKPEQPDICLRRFFVFTQSTSSSPSYDHHPNTGRQAGRHSDGDNKSHRHST